MCVLISFQRYSILFHPEKTHLHLKVIGHHWSRLGRLEALERLEALGRLGKIEKNRKNRKKA